MTETVNGSRLGRMPDTKAEQLQRWSRAIYVGEIGISIALAMVLLAQSPLPTRDLVALFTGGYFAWTLAEYASIVSFFTISYQPNTYATMPPPANPSPMFFGKEIG